MTRRSARERALQFLFQMEFNPEEIESALARFWRECEISESARVFTEILIRGVLENKDTIDSKIKVCADNWSIRRIGAIDRTVLRVALFEMFFREEIPPVVSINEAVDIAKKFGSAESGHFVNGILDRAKKELVKSGDES